MLKHILLIAFTLGLAACQSGDRADKNGEDSTIQRGDSSGASDTASVGAPAGGSDSMNLVRLKARFEDAPNPFKGLWVSEHYVNAILQGKSLRASQDSETSCIVIPGRTLQVTQWIFGFHEGSGDIVFVKKGADYFTYQLYDGQCMDTLEPLADGRLRIRYANYIRIGERDSSRYDLGVLEQLFFAGRWLRTGGGDTAVFAKTGRIDGLDSLGAYEPVIDYADFPTNIDHIRLGRNKKHMNDYGLRRAGDTMTIYTIDCRKRADGECVDDTLGHMLYSLIKLKAGS